MPIVKRPLLVTLISVVLILYSLCSLFALTFVLAAFCVNKATVAIIITQLFPSLSLLMFGSDLGLLGWIMLAYMVGVYCFVQGYGFWKLRTWSWWLYVAWVIYSTLILVMPSFRTEFNVLIEIVALLFLGYLIMHRDRFNVRIPEFPF
jgi:hypothetical protein